MKLLVGTVCLALAVAVSAVDLKTPEDITVFDYHRRFGIPKASEIKKAEENAAISNRIVGGSVSDISQTPYQVGLVITILWIYASVCGGSLISTDRVLTAAHCNNDGSFSANSFTAVLGSNTLFSGGTRIRTTNVVMHPNWSPVTAANDVAVLRITPVTYSNVIQPIALPSGSELNEAFVDWRALASGYGHTSDGGSIGTNQVLSSVTLTVITNVQCAATFGPYVHNTNICTSGANGQGTCGGDSGGPLAVDLNGRRVVIGITSYGADAGCALGFPAAFARVTSFVDWILSQ